jgi:TolA-binding protein
MLIAAPALSAADKTPDKTLEILRELGGLQEQIKGLEKSLEGKLAELGQANADQARTAAEQAAKTIAALSDRLRKGLQDQQDQQTKTLSAVAGLGSQLQSVSSDVGTLKEAMNDLAAAMTKLSTKVNDLASAVKSAQGPGPTAGGRPEISATDLFANAEGDRMGGKLDLALQEYAEYVTKFGDSGQAPEALYYIGSIHYSNQEWDAAVRAFDVLLQTHPDSKKLIPEALFYKADSLARLGRWPDANQTLADLRKRFPADAMAKRSLTVKPPAFPRLQ